MAAEIIRQKLSLAPQHARIITLILTFGFVLSSCSSAYDNRNCNRNSPRVSDTRVVTLFTEIRIYGSSTDIPAVRGVYFSKAATQVENAYNVANRIFRDNNINVQLFPSAPHQVVDDALDIIPADFGQGSFGPNNADTEKVIQAMLDSYHSNELIAIHWAEWYVGPGTSNGSGWGSQPCDIDPKCTWDRSNWVLLAGTAQAGYGNEAIGRMVAHELGHYFGLPHNNTDPTNLMNDTTDGTTLTSNQRGIIWNTINSKRTSLYVVTCDPPVEPAPPTTISGG